MALLDVSELLIDPDFTDSLTLIRRTSTVNSFGENILSETSIPITAVVHGGNDEMLNKLPQGAKLTDYIMVYYRGKLYAESPGGYSDLIVWNGFNYQVFNVVDDFENFGVGFTIAICKIEN